MKFIEVNKTVSKCRIRTERVCWRLAVLVLLGLIESTVARAGRGDEGGDQGPERPNIVVIMADDLDVVSLESMLRAGLMPNLATEVIEKGATFTNSFVTNPLCCPSRATFLTGRYSHNHGVWTNLNVARGGAAAFDDSSTVATWLRNAGYRTGFVGKYLNGYGNQAPVDSPATDPRYVPPGWDDWQALIDPSTYQMYGYQINDNGTVLQMGDGFDDERPELYQTDVLAGLAREFIHESTSLEDERPFFLNVMTLAPHVELRDEIILGDISGAWALTVRPAPRHQGSISLPLSPAPSFNEDDVSDKPRWLRQNYPLLTSGDVQNLRRQFQNRLASLRAVDDLIGTVFASLEDAGILERTVILFTSDNGFMLGRHRLPQKLYAYEESIRVPLYLRVPGFTRGQTVVHIVLNNDLAPSIAELAGVVPEVEVDGRSFIPLLRDPTPRSWRKRFLIDHWLSLPTPLEIPTYSAIRTSSDSVFIPDEVFVEYRVGTLVTAVEFYDLRSDPFQLESLHRADGFRFWQRVILKWYLNRLRECSGAECWDLESE